MGREVNHLEEQQPIERSNSKVAKPAWPSTKSLLDGQEVLARANSKVAKPAWPSCKSILSGEETITRSNSKVAKPAWPSAKSILSVQPIAEEPEPLTRKQSKLAKCMWPSASEVCGSDDSSQAEMTTSEVKEIIMGDLETGFRPSCQDTIIDVRVHYIRREVSQPNKCMLALLAPLALVSGYLMILTTMSYG